MNRSRWLWLGGIMSLSIGSLVVCADGNSPQIPPPAKSETVEPNTLPLPPNLTNPVTPVVNESPTPFPTPNVSGVASLNPPETQVPPKASNNSIGGSTTPSNSTIQMELTIPPLPGVEAPSQPKNAINPVPISGVSGVSNAGKLPSTKKGETPKNQPKAETVVPELQDASNESTNPVPFTVTPAKKKTVPSYSTNINPNELKQNLAVQPNQIVEPTPNQFNPKQPPLQGTGSLSSAPVSNPSNASNFAANRNTVLPAPPRINQADQRKFKLVLRMGDGISRFEIRTIDGQNLLLKVTAEKIDIQSNPVERQKSPLTGITATGKVTFKGSGIDGSCDQLMILSETGEVLMKGNVVSKSRQGKKYYELNSDKMVFQLGVLATKENTVRRRISQEQTSITINNNSNE